MKRCKHNFVCLNCLDFVPFRCSRRDSAPGACNGYSKFKNCRYDKYKYFANISHRECKKDLIVYKIGINISYNELKSITNIVIPLIKVR